MANTITLNGKSSSTITGLLIQELPPFTKPLMRTETETIDGRDGDIITDLGYSAYDKTITIGLHGNFDINDVIAYFDSEGVVTFSNEPDKFYNYKIIEQIDFERLVRYRTATVTLHCQPFKYSTTETAQTLGGSGQTVTGEGTNFTMQDTAETTFSEITPKGHGVVCSHLLHRHVLEDDVWRTFQTFRHLLPQIFQHRTQRRIQGTDTTLRLD